MKYLACALPMLLCVEVISYACLATIGIMFVLELMAVGKGWSNGSK